MKLHTARRLAALLLAILLCCTAGCASAADDPASESSAIPTAPPEAYSILYPVEIYPEEESSAPPTAEPTPDPTEAPTPEPAAEPAEITEEITAMYPLLEAHTLALLNGNTYDPEDPFYFWQTIIFAMDTCGMDFYTAETMGSALVLSRGVIEEMASGLFEGAGEALLEIPDELSDMIQYDQSADAFSCALNEGYFRIEPQTWTQTEEEFELTAAFYIGEDPEAAANLSAVLVPNTRAGNSLFTYTIRSITLTA